MEVPIKWQDLVQTAGSLRILWLMLLLIALDESVRVMLV